MKPARLHPPLQLEFAPGARRIPVASQLLLLVCAAALGLSLWALAHSLGALLLRHALALHPQLPVAACVLLGPPNRGSHVARRLSAAPVGRSVLACGLAHGLDGSAPDWPAHVPVRIIAGTRALGLGRLIPGLAVPNDGTVALEETRLAGATEPLVLDETHTGMLLSARVAEAVAEFLAANAGPG